MHETASNKVVPSTNRAAPFAYLAVGLVWYAFLMVALKVRINELVFLWVLTQGLLMERVPLSRDFWSSRALLLVAYQLAGLLAWWIVERGGRNPSHVWRRALLVWVGIQIIYCLVATLLVQVGILYE